MTEFVVTLDFETRSYADLVKVGAWAYSEDETTEVICVCWGVGNEPIQTWCPFIPGHVVPLALFQAVMSGALIEAHNVAFERSIWENIMVPVWGWPKVKPEQWRDLMAVACYYALPPKLDKLAAALKFEGKDPRGGRLISKYSKLHLKTASVDLTPEVAQQYVEYCIRDVQLEQSISDYLGPLPDRELQRFLLSQEINHRGLYLDREGISAAAALVEQRSLSLAQEFKKLTGYTPSQHARVLAWFKENGLPELENLQAETLEELIEEGDIGQGPCRRALELRLEINKASTKKLDAMARQCGRDSRARFQTRYHGAVTGRETGSGFQPLNMNRGIEKWNPDDLVRDIMYGDAAWLDLVYGDAIDAIGKASRHWIMAEAGRRILAGDFVSVEAVVLSCLAGEQWKIDAFASGAKIYELMADKIYSLPPGTVTKETHPLERQDGKTGELAFGYQGALGAWLKFDNSGRHTDDRIIEICRSWREQHPMIVKLWRQLEWAAISAVQSPGREYGYRQIGFKVIDEWLTMVLPNGKRLWYFEPEVREGWPNWHKPKEKNDCKLEICDCEKVPKLGYMSQKSGQWKRVYTYGGKLTENATQATSREILEVAKDRAAVAGYPIILSVYDELVAEVPEGFGSKKEFGEIMRQPAGDWCEDWPINVDVWEGKRYKK